MYFNEALKYALKSKFSFRNIISLNYFVSVFVNIIKKTTFKN